jgi:hypothetical protein
MKHLLKNSFIAIILLFSTVTFSQNDVTNEEISNHYGMMRLFDSRSKELVGTSYIQEDYFPAKFTNDETIFSVKYDAYQDEMEVSKDGKYYYLKKQFNFPVTFIGVNNSVYQVFDYDDNGSEKKGFFVMLYKGNKISLLLKQRIVLIAEVKARTGYDKYQPPTLVRSKDKLYIGYKNNTTSILPKKKSEFFTLFSNNAKAIEKYAKSNKLSIKNNDDLIKIFTYYNSL